MGRDGRPERDGAIFLALATVHYELQVLRGERWVIDAVLHERSLALDEARRITTSPDADGVRVVKECYSLASDTTSARTIFEEIRPRRPKPRRRPPPLPAEPAVLPPAPEPERRTVRAAPRPPPAEPPWWRSAAGLSSLAAVALGLVVTTLLLLA